MPTRKNKICACGKILRDGRCTAIPSCSDFKQPKDRYRRREARRRAEADARRLPSMREIAAGAARALSKAGTQLRTGGDATVVERW